MKHIKKVLLASILVGSAGAYAGGTARVVCDRYYPALEITYTTGADAGVPGLLWIGVLTSDKSGGAFHNGKSWQGYTGGLYPFHARYDSGFPSTIKLNLPFPGRRQTTSDYQGYTVYTGNGVYTSEMREQVRERREAVNQVKPDMVAKGMWREEFGSDDFHMMALVQHDLTMNKKYGMIYTIPFVDCNPSDGGGG